MRIQSQTVEAGLWDRPRTTFNAPAGLKPVSRLRTAQMSVAVVVMRSRTVRLSWRSDPLLPIGTSWSVDSTGRPPMKYHSSADSGYHSVLCSAESSIGQKRCRQSCQISLSLHNAGPSQSDIISMKRNMTSRSGPSDQDGES